MSLRPILLLALALVAAACSAPRFDAKAVATEWAAYMQRDYVLRAGDRLSVRVENFVADGGEGAEGVQEVVVSPTGSVDLRRLLAPQQVAGKSVGAVRTQLAEAYKSVWDRPTVSVTLIEAATQSVYVCGEVNAAGPIPYVPGLTMTQAIAAAGSFRITVKHSDVRVLRINADGSQRTFRVNMDAVLSDEWPDFLLLPGDVVYCQTSGIADAGNWVELWIRRLLPIQIGAPAVGSP